MDVFVVWFVRFVKFVVFREMFWVVFRERLASKGVQFVEFSSHMGGPVAEGKRSSNIANNR